MKYLLLALLFVGCSHTGNVSLSNLNLFNQDSEISSEAETVQENLHIEGNRPLTEEDKKLLKEGMQKGIEFYEKSKKSSSLNLEVIKRYVDYESDEHNRAVERFLKKNRKAKGLHRDVILVAAVAYVIFSEWTVFEGLRTLERQKYLKDVRKVTWTLKSKHLIGLAMDILGKDKRGKFSFKAIDDLGMARGILYAAWKDLYDNGLVCLEWVRVLRWKRIRDAYHIEFKEGKKCGKRT